LPDVSCDDKDEWAAYVCNLHDAILWDNDYLHEEDFVDFSPEDTEAIKQAMRIEPEYFLAIAPDPTTSQMEILRDELVAMCVKVSEAVLAKTAVSERKPSEKKKKSGGKGKNNGKGKGKKKPPSE